MLATWMVGKKIDAVVLGLRGGVTDIEPEAWVTSYPIPFEARELILTRVLWRGIITT